MNFVKNVLILKYVLLVHLKILQFNKLNKHNRIKLLKQRNCYQIKTATVFAQREIILI